jgi:hypothetical protein
MSTSYLKLKDFLQLTARLESAHPGFGASYLGLGVAADITLHPPVVSSSLSTHTSSDKQHLTRRRRCTLVTPNNHPPILHTSLSSVQNHRSQPLCKVQIPCCSSSFLLSEYLAQIDEVTTWELVLNDDKRNRAGVSVQLHAQWTTNYDHIQKHPDKNEEEDPSNIRDWDRRPDDRRGAMFVELIPNVIKIGRNIALVDAQVVAVTTPASGAIENNNDHQSRHQILSASHIKYMPMGFVTDWALRHWKLLQLYSQYCMSSGAAVVAARNHKTRTDLLQCLEYPSHPPDATTTTTTTTTSTKAIFHILPWHASLGGPIHGGCQAILMELVAHQAMTTAVTTTNHWRESGNNTVALQLDAMTVDYLSPPVGCETVQITATFDPILESNAQRQRRRNIIVEIRDTQRIEKLYSRGTLQYVATPERIQFM